MEIYLVGGAVRDQLLGLPVHERDWVVVGSTPEEMLGLGYKPVGKDFPVFLHPKTHEEYALARTERKTAKGYKGFSFYTSPEVSLTEDLLRRDLTINAIAQADDGSLIDPYGGQADLENKILRHVSAAFQEDPVRILRLARFASRFTDFTVHPTTLQLMRTMVDAGEVHALVSERVWQEMARALAEHSPSRFFTILAECGALAILLPELLSSGAGPQALKLAEAYSSDPQIRLAILLNDLQLADIKNLGQRLRVPSQYLELALQVSQFKVDYLNLDHQPKAILDLLVATDALRRPERFEQFITAAELIYKPQAIDFTRHYPLKQALTIIKAVDTKSLVAQGLQGPKFAEALYAARLQALNSAI